MLAERISQSMNSDDFVLSFESWMDVCCMDVNIEYVTVKLGFSWGDYWSLLFISHQITKMSWKLYPFIYYPLMNIDSNRHTYMYTINTTSIQIKDFSHFSK